MFRVNLTDLDRQGSTEVEGRIPPDDPLWKDSDAVSLEDPVEVRLVLTATPTGQVIARGTLEATLTRSCRRCLTDVDVSIREDLNLVWSVPDELDAEADDGEIRTLDPATNELDLRDAIREEFLLAVPRFVECGPDCSGLCPQCGINRNHETCDCTLKEPDPRWDALRALTNE